MRDSEQRVYSSSSTAFRGWLRALGVTIDTLCTPYITFGGLARSFPNLTSNVSILSAARFTAKDEKKS